MGIASQSALKKGLQSIKMQPLFLTFLIFHFNFPTASAIRPIAFRMDSSLAA